MSSPAHERLTRLLTELFAESDELRRFLAYEFGDQFAARLPGRSVSPATFAYEATDELMRQGLVHEPFFTALARARPERVPDILALARDDAPTTTSTRPGSGPPRLPPGFIRVYRPYGDDPLLKKLEGIWNARHPATPIERCVLQVEDIRSFAFNDQWEPDDHKVALDDVGHLLLPLLHLVLAEPSRHAWQLAEAEARYGVPVVALAFNADGAAWSRSHGIPLLNLNPRQALDSNPDGAVWKEVVEGLEQHLLAKHPPRDSQSIAPSTPATPMSSSRPSIPSSAEPLRLTDIFSTTGVPTLSYVEPAQHADLIARLDFMGEGLVVEGPSGTGKTTAVQRALEAYFGKQPLAALTKERKVTWYDARLPRDQQRLRQLVKRRPATLRHQLVIDDFHRLDRDLQRDLADLLKSLADASRLAKITLIGVSPVGESLVRDFPDLAGRFYVVSMRKQPDDRVRALIQRGEREANLEFSFREEFVALSRGSFFTAQLLCAEAILMEGLRERPTELRTLAARPHGVLHDRVCSRLKFKYHDELLRFASYDESPPPRGACLALLWLLAERDEGSVQLQTATTRFSGLAPAFRWLMASNFTRLFEARPRLRELFFYNRDGAVLSVEDPQLEFYLGGLNWTAFARDSGHVGVDWSARGLIFGAAPGPATPTSSPRRALPRSWILHLSDLHFSREREALEWSAQLREDLRAEFGPAELRAVVISGDLTNRAASEEFAAAQRFVLSLRDDFGLTPEQFILVPGNHDLSWERSRAAYGEIMRRDALARVPDDAFENNGYVELLSDQDAYRSRFAAFAAFYHSVRAEPYPLEPEQQALLYPLVDARILVLGLNSAWRIDHHFRGRADIHGVALGNALNAIHGDPRYRDFLKIAVWHHPAHGPDDDRIRETGFLERLAAAGFRVALHGHIHRADQNLFRYDMSAAGRRLDFLGAGTFGAPTHEMTPGYPLQYQLLESQGDALRVHTRRREQRSGAWKPDARWSQGPGLPPLPFYTIEL